MTVELSPNNIASQNGGTKLHLAHTGFPDETSRKRHEDAWPMVLAQLDKKIAADI